MSIYVSLTQQKVFFKNQHEEKRLVIFNIMICDINFIRQFDSWLIELIWRSVSDQFKKLDFNERNKNNTL